MKRKRKQARGMRREKLVAIALIAVMLVTLAVALKDKIIRTLLSPQVVMAIAVPATIGVQIQQSVFVQTPPEPSENGDAHETPIPDGGEENPGEILQLEPDVPESIRIELLDEDGDAIDLSGIEPKVLIYHTHTTEAYTMTPGLEYAETSKWRTAQHSRSIVAVGELLAIELRSRGVAVIHDVTDHEPPKLDSAYSRSLITMEKYRAQYPSVILFIDVHRDAAGEALKNDYVTIDGKQVARMMFVVGTGEGKTGAGFDIKPDFKANYRLAKTITENLNAVNPKLMRPIRVKTGRYNQHLPGRSLLVEVGHNRNTLDQALAAIPYLADAILKASKADAIA